MRVRWTYEWDTVEPLGKTDVHVVAKVDGLDVYLSIIAQQGRIRFDVTDTGWMRFGDGTVLARCEWNEWLDLMVEEALTREEEFDADEARVG